MYLMAPLLCIRHGDIFLAEIGLAGYSWYGILKTTEDREEGDQDEMGIH